MVWVIHSQILDLIILYNSRDGISNTFTNIGSNNIVYNVWEGLSDTYIQET